MREKPDHLICWEIRPQTVRPDEGRTADIIQMLHRCSRSNSGHCMIPVRWGAGEYTLSTLTGVFLPQYLFLQFLDAYDATLRCTDTGLERKPLLDRLQVEVSTPDLTGYWTRPNWLPLEAQYATNYQQTTQTAVCYPLSGMSLCVRHTAPNAWHWLCWCWVRELFYSQTRCPRGIFASKSK